jgi:hypothetical protein
MKTATVIQMSIARLACTACGAEANASCNCGQPYMPAKQRAKEAIEANPQKSNRAIADEIGVDHKTVGAARGEYSPPEVIGRDGKTYPATKPKRNPAATVEDESIEFVVEGDDESWPEAARKALRRERLEYVDLLGRVTGAEQRCNELIVALNAKEVTEGRDWPLDKMTKKQIAKRDTALAQIASWQKSLERLYAEATGQPPWRVEVITKEGRRFANGVRFAFRNEAERYAKKQEQDGDGVAAEVIASDGEKPNVEVNGDSIGFRHGDCVLFDWQSVEGDQ